MCPRHFPTPLPAREGPSGNQAGLEQRYFDPGAGRPAATLPFCPFLPQSPSTCLCGHLLGCWPGHPAGALCGHLENVGGWAAQVESSEALSWPVPPTHTHPRASEAPTVSPSSVTMQIGGNQGCS